MRSKLNHRGLLALTLCVALTVMSTGCRSGKSGMNLFSFRSEPSPEALAGSGPTTTYPTPPGHLATPEAIASVAGGTMAPGNSPITSPRSSSPTAQVAGLDITPGYVTPAANTAAARSNGFTSPQPTTPPAISPGVIAPGVTAPKTSPSSGYQFGTNAAVGGSSYNIPSSYTAPAAAPSAPATKPGGTTSQAGGFTLPSDLGSITPAAATSTPLGPTVSISDNCDSCEGCASCQAAKAPSSTLFTPSPALGASGYSPGSLSSAGDYPGSAK